VKLRDRSGQEAEGWGECPLNVQWAWPSQESYALRFDAMITFCRILAAEFASFADWGHPMELGDAFQREVLPNLMQDFEVRGLAENCIPPLAALVACAPFDLAIHDAYGCLHDVPIYQTYNSVFLNRDLADFYGTNGSGGPDLRGIYPSAFMTADPPKSLTVWHMLGRTDPLSADELTGLEPRDEYPVLLEDWIDADGIYCLKIKLKGDDAEWDYQRLARGGQIALDKHVRWLAADFNCGAEHPAYVTSILDRLAADAPRVFEALLYIEQPFAHDLVTRGLDVREIARRKSLLMDESAHNWQLVERGRQLGWTGVALKTCKTQTGAILSLCWAKAHDMPVMVQDLTNPMLALIPHAQLAAHAGTLMGLESNAMQFYPDASRPEALVHPGLFRRRHGALDLSSIRGPGFGYRLDEIKRLLPKSNLRCASAEESTQAVDPSVPTGS
jgi:L-alanine-DL-glutamate epimerase-like enolase superfamily enzyme